MEIKGLYRYKKWIVALGAVIIIILGWFGMCLASAYQSAKGLQQECNKVAQFFSSQDYKSANRTLTNCQLKIKETRQDLGRLRFSSFGILNGVINSLDKSLAVAVHLTEDGKGIASQAEDWSKVAPAEKNIFQFILKNYSEIFQLNHNIQNHKDELVRALDENFFTRIFLKGRLSSQLAVITEVTGLINQLESYSKVLFWAMAFDQPKTFLVFFQNSSELRPTGGFWGSYGILKISNGKIISLTTDDIYHLDVNLIGQETPVMPAPIAKYLKTEQWFLRDANWSPNFAESALLGQEMYRLAGGQERFDGVIAITPQLLEDLLTYLGPIILEGQQFSRENFLDQLQYEVERGYQEKSITSWNRKDILQALVGKFIEKLPGSLTVFKDIEELLALIDNNLQEKNILWQSNNPEIQAEIISHNWGGAINPSPDDYLAVVDANLASFKTDSFIEREIFYSVGLEKTNQQSEIAIANLKINYTHHGDFDWKTTRYRTYTRVYVPAGSTLISVEGVMADDRNSTPGQVDVFNEYGKTVFGGFIAIEPQQGGGLTFKYQLPERILNKLKSGQYHLLLQKQPGVDNQTVQIEIDNNQTVKKIFWTNNNYLNLDNRLIINKTSLIKDSHLIIDYRNNL